jgi:hypothetical protein
MGPKWIDDHLTITNNPIKTSFGAVSIQLRVAAETMGENPKTISYDEQKELIEILSLDTRNLQIVARHLANLAKYDFPNALSLCLTSEQMRIVRARYNRGIGISMEQLKKNTSYGDFILRNLPRILELLRK